MVHSDTHSSRDAAGADKNTVAGHIANIRIAAAAASFEGRSRDLGVESIHTGQTEAWHKDKACRGT